MEQDVLGNYLDDENMDTGTLSYMSFQT